MLESSNQKKKRKKQKKSVVIISYEKLEITGFTDELGGVQSFIIFLSYTFKCNITITHVLETTEILPNIRFTTNDETS